MRLHVIRSSEQRFGDKFSANQLRCRAMFPDISAKERRVSRLVLSCAEEMCCTPALAGSTIHILEALKCAHAPSGARRKGFRDEFGANQLRCCAMFPDISAKERKVLRSF